jgi:hypothetical protein
LAVEAAVPAASAEALEEAVPPVAVLVEVALASFDASALETAEPSVALAVEVEVPPVAVTALLFAVDVWPALETALASEVAPAPSPFESAVEVPPVVTALETDAPPFSAFDVAPAVPPFAAA